MTRLGSEPSPLDPKPYALTIRLPRLLHSIFYFYKDEYVILSLFLSLYFLSILVCCYNYIAAVSKHLDKFLPCFATSVVALLFYNIIENLYTVFVS